MVRLEVRDNEDTVVEAYNLEVDPGATVAISGFHGSRVYEVTDFDTALVVKFTGVSNVSSADKEVKAEQQETEEGVKESEAEAMQRTLAENQAKVNDEKKAKSPTKTEAKPAPAETVKSSKS